ncbi:hypothetical protein KC19_VG305700 [Ceratodon purpureus]|uniref:Uncharacterized protein n=1 Tax=Ceratodon purpureus TaxID=3225 RepID=A0A8T0HW93_CERPU|nr:hypothetical protein KC19_VG305700 [Ceratodon purpureus]
MDTDMRLPVHDNRRREARDVKLEFREELVADRIQAFRRVCACNICLGENRSLRFKAVVRDDLRRYGRHAYHQGSTQGIDPDESDAE